MTLRFHVGRIIAKVRMRWKKLLLFFISIFIGLLIAEAVVSAFNLDWRVISRMLIYQNADARSHMHVDDRQLIYRLKPGFTDYKKYSVSVNEFGFRDPKRSAKKKPGIFRIICYGGSNVYGLGLEDNQTWPAMLEKQLNEEKQATQFEVWNGGVCAWVPSQMAAAARIDYNKYHPDLVILSLSNGGAPPFPYGTDPKPYFRNFPDLWADFFTANCTPGPDWIPYRWRVSSLIQSRFLRFAGAAMLMRREKCLWYNNYHHELNNQRRTRSFLQWAKGKMKVGLFLYPGCQENLGHYNPYLDNIEVPVLQLVADGLPDKYLDIHPDAQVTKWYAEKISTWIRVQELLPEKSGGEP
jgi:lysophospholipase L1-like esterase